VFTCHHLWSRPLKFFVALAVFSIFGTILTKYTGLSPGIIPQAASILLIGTGVCIVGRSLQPLYLLLGVLILGASVEIIGIYQEVPFGNYLYTDKWWPITSLPGKLVAEKSLPTFFPLQLPFAWLMIVGGTFASLSKLQDRRWLRVLLTAVLATVIDFFMEEVMVRVFHYWTWQEALGNSPSLLPGGAPLLNSMGWFGVALVGAFVLSFSKAEKKECEDSNESLMMLTFYVLLMLVAYLFRV
jgi:uncharacterized membrane protein